MFSRTRIEANKDSVASVSGLFVMAGQVRPQKSSFDTLLVKAELILTLFLILYGENDAITWT